MLLGTPNAESSRLYAMTVTEGDPSWAGALAGVALGLPVYHVLEEAVKAYIRKPALAADDGEVVLPVGAQSFSGTTRPYDKLWEAVVWAFGAPVVGRDCAD